MKLEHDERFSESPAGDAIGLAVGYQFNLDLDLDLILRVDLRWDGMPQVKSWALGGELMTFRKVEFGLR